MQRQRLDDKWVLVEKKDIFKEKYLCSTNSASYISTLFLFISGQVYYLTKSKHELGKFQIMNPPGQFFSRSLLLFDNMILHHLQHYYEEAFANVDLEDFK